MKNKKIEKLDSSDHEAIKNKVNEIIELLNSLNLGILGTRMVETMNRMTDAMDLLPPVNNKDS